MALQMKVPQKGGINHSNGYVRVTDVRACRKDDGSAFIMVDLACYKNKAERDKGVEATRLMSPELDKRKYPLPVDIGKDPFAWAYGKLKIDPSMTSIGAMTDV